MYVSILFLKKSRSIYPAFTVCRISLLGLRGDKRDYGKLLVHEGKSGVNAGVGEPQPHQRLARSDVSF